MRVQILNQDELVAAVIIVPEGSDAATWPVPAGMTARLETSENQHAPRAGQGAADELAAALSAGYPVQPEGFTLSMADADRSQFAQLATLLLVALQTGHITPDALQPIRDADGTLHMVGTSRLLEILVGYGQHYHTLWAAAGS